MKKAWNAPAMKELDILETAKTTKDGEKYDYAEWDDVEQTFKYSYYASGEKSNGYIDDDVSDDADKYKP